MRTIIALLSLTVALTACSNVPLESAMPVQRGKLYTITELDLFYGRGNIVPVADQRCQTIGAKLVVVSMTKRTSLLSNDDFDVLNYRCE